MDTSGNWRQRSGSWSSTTSWPTGWRRASSYAGSLRAALSNEPLFLPAAGTLALYLVLFLVLRAKSLLLTPTRTVDRWPWLRNISDRLTPDALVMAPPGTLQAAVSKGLFGLVLFGLIALWLAATRRAQLIFAKLTPLQVSG